MIATKKRRFKKLTAQIKAEKKVTMSCWWPRPWHGPWSTPQVNGVGGFIPFWREEVARAEDAEYFLAWSLTPPCLPLHDH
jgi:hypothetical protein